MSEQNTTQPVKQLQAEFVIPHSEAIGFKSVTIVTADVAGEESLKSAVFLESLRRAITRWINGTARGKEAWEESCEDFNIGDLGNEFPLDETLIGFLADEGISNLKLDTYGGGSRDWVRDSHLFNELDIAEEPAEE